MTPRQRAEMRALVIVLGTLTAVASAIFYFVAYGLPT